METEAVSSSHLSEARVMTPESPYLLQLSTLLDYITEEKMKYLTKTFHKLDGDKDGWVYSLFYYLILILSI